MKRFFWIPTALLLALFASVLVNAAAAEQCVAQWCDALARIETAAQAEDWDDAAAELAALHESWDAHATYFHIILQHDELNEVETLLARAERFALSRDTSELRACAAELTAQLRVLSEMQKISIPNIL